MEGFFTRRHPWIAAAVLVPALVLTPFAWRTNSDPDLPSYFSEDGAVGQGLRAIDPSTGSSPLDLVVVNASGAALDNRDSFERLMALHDALRENKEVGSALSIALLMEETDRRWYSFLFGWERKLKQLEKPEQGRIGDAFISDDRKRGRYILRMHEMSRERPRAEIVAEIEQIVAEHGFEAEAVGGLYVLQGEMSKLVDASVVRGLGGLLALFFVIVLIVSRSLRTAAAMALCLTATPLILFGAAGWLRMPLDIIARGSCRAP
jgi:predicted RND superfamily exporter protein